MKVGASYINIRKNKLYGETTTKIKSDFILINIFSSLEYLAIINAYDQQTYPLNM